MLCSNCGAELGPRSVCAACGQPAPVDVTGLVTSLNPPPSEFEQPTIASAAGTPSPQPPVPQRSRAEPRATGPLQAGSPFGSRYHLIRLLGAGGMGAVYQAWDEELGTVVAIKVIRPESMADPAAARDLERRFKRELLLARNVTHKNVVRIHDLGEIDGIKYITMPYVHGSDLVSLLKQEGKLPVPRALQIARQIASGLVAAHEAGVVHRDLKPANILLDEEDHALITDFGIARSVSGPGGGTVAGAVVGTLEYMAPEQARAETVDHRADIYAFGLIFADMLVGLRQAVRAESAVAELLQRMTTVFPSLRSIDPTIPQALDEVVARCVKPDPTQRYQRTEDLLADLDAAGAGGHTTSPVTASPVTAIPLPPPAAAGRSLPFPRTGKGWALLSAVTVALVLATVAFAFRDRITWAGSSATPAETEQQVSLLVLPFRNASGDRSLDSLGPSLAAMLRTEIGHSSALRTVPGNRVSQILTDLRISADANVEPAMLQSLAEFSSADTVVWGQYVKFGNEIRIDATLQDVRGQRTVPLKATAANEPAIPEAVEQLAASVRSNLALSSEAVRDLAASAWTPSSDSVRALRYYNEGIEAIRQGENADAAQRLESATEEDPEFALAYSGLAQAYALLGRMNEAERTSRKAIDLSGALPRQERYLILATHARMMNDGPKAIEYFEDLDEIMPGNDEVEFALASLYKDAGEFDRARTLFDRLLARDPKYIEALLGAGEVESWSGRGTEALEYLNRAQSIAVQRGNDEAKARALLALGSAYSLLNKPTEALRYCEESLAIERRLGRTAGIADSLHALGLIHDLNGESEPALENYQEALNLSRKIGNRQAVGNIQNDLGSFYASRGRLEEALPHFKEALQAQREVRNQVYEAMALNNIGTIYMSLGRYDDAQTYLQQALAVRERANVPSDAADTLHNLAEVSLRTGAFDSALGQYLKALELRRQVGDERGAAIEQYHLGTLYEYEGRYGAAVESKAEAVEIFRKLEGSGLWLPKVLASYGSALHQAGRVAEAEQTLQEAMELARGLQNDELAVQISIAQGDGAFYQGDFERARRHYEAAEALAGRTNLRQQQLTARLNLAWVGLAEGEAPSTAALDKLGAEAERLGLKFEAVRAALLAAEADLDAKRYERARERLDSTLAQAERLEARTLLARSHHLAAAANEALGNPADARRHAESATQLLEAIRVEARGDAVLSRFDLNQLSEPVLR